MAVLALMKCAEWCDRVLPRALLKSSSAIFAEGLFGYNYLIRREPYGSRIMRPTLRNDIHNMGRHVGRKSWPKVLLFK